MQTENNLSFLDLVKKRRTIRKFTEQALTQEEVVDLMKVPLLAPSSRNRQPLQYILVDNKDDLSRLSECKPSGAQPLKHAALAVVVLADSNLSDTWIEDASIASSMILLQAQALNLGACWIQIRLRSFPRRNKCRRNSKKHIKYSRRYKRSFNHCYRTQSRRASCL